MIFLPDDTFKSGACAGKVRLTKDVILVDVLFVPGFTLNLLSVAQLIADPKVKCVFYSTHCFFQKEQTDQLLGVGKMRNNLYYIEFVTVKYYGSLLNTREMTTKDCDISLGHPSITTMRKINLGARKFHA